MTITIEITDRVAELLAVLCGLEPDSPTSRENRVRAVIETLIDHAQQGVYRPGSWERPWLTQAFGEDWTAHLEPDEPYYPGATSFFMKPKGRQS